ncbi:hypothetical protein AN652_18600 [Xanthomonas arboricola pv. pruni]|nr:hypothetical protein DK27_17275 [Xanthomonas arboricola pv. pruni]KPN07351.1 hypothetical protein AN652_18600 [Xanthomonas arboricola pv. pruni]OEH52920.1 hypothetical protein XapnCFBP3894_01450 [Xanthomonas arboricola pv. pruni]
MRLEAWLSPVRVMGVSAHEYGMERFQQSISPSAGSERRHPFFHREKVPRRGGCGDAWSLMR